MSTNFTDYDRLFDLWIAGTLAPNEAEELYLAMEDNPDILNRFRMNVLADFLLEEHFDLVRKSQLEPARSVNDIKTLYEECVVATEENSWEELIAIQNSLPPIQREKVDVKEPVLWGHRIWIFAKNCVWPDSEARKETIAPAVTLIAVLLFTIIGVIFWMERKRDLSESISIPAMARVAQTIEPVWSEDAISYKRGQLIDTQTSFSLVSGLVQLEMNNGTKIILEGPTELSLFDSMKAFCQSGKVSIRVPPNAIGYELSTPFGSVVDRGTEFFVDVSRNTTHTEVMEGKVEFSRVGLPVIPLQQGHCLSYDVNKKETVTPVVKSRGMTSQFFDKLVFRYCEKWITEKKLARKELDSSPNLLVRFNGNDTQNEVVQNASIQGSTLCPELRLSRCSKGPGLMDGLKSIRFESSRSFAQFALPGKYDSMTFYVSCRLSQLSKQGEMILASNQFLDKAGSCQWRIFGSGEVCLFLTPSKGKQISFVTKPIIFKRDCETWIHLAIVIDKDKKTVTHYYDGKPVASSRWNKPFPIILEDTLLGNMKNASLNFSNRCFNGSIEELQIWNRALSPAEIAKISN